MHTANILLVARLLDEKRWELRNGPFGLRGLIPFSALVFGDSPFSEVPIDDIQELVEMLDLVPFDLLIRTPLILNPSFGEASRLIGGADTDLVVGDTLIDVKTTSRDTIDPGWLDQSLGYFLLARRHRAANPDFPAITRLGFYFSRQGRLWMRPTKLWTEHPSFAGIEKWFFEECERRRSLRLRKDGGALREKLVSGESR